MFPGVILHLSYWYRADEMTMRLLWFCTLSWLDSLPFLVIAMI